MFVGETEVRYVLDFISDNVYRHGKLDMGLTFKSMIKKWMQAYDLQDAYPYIWEEVSTES